MRAILLPFLLAAVMPATAQAADATPSPSPSPRETPAEVVLPKSPELPPVPTPTPAATASATPAPRPGRLDAWRTRWPVQVTLSWDQGLAKRTLHTALDHSAGARSEETILVAADASPWRGLAIGADLAVDSTRSLLVPAGGSGCGAYTLASTGQNCQPFTKDVWYVTQTNYASLWAKPYLTFGSFRAFAAVGAGLATVDYLYTKDPAFDDQSWGKGTSHVFGVNAAVGGDWAWKLSSNGACFIVSASVATGGPRYGEHVRNLFYPNHVWSSGDVGSAVNPLRFAIGAGFSFPTRHPPGG